MHEISHSLESEVFVVPGMAGVRYTRLLIVFYSASPVLGSASPVIGSASPVISFASLVLGSAFPVLGSASPVLDSAFLSAVSLLSRLSRVYPPPTQRGQTSIYRR